MDAMHPSSSRAGMTIERSLSVIDLASLILQNVILGVAQRSGILSKHIRLASWQVSILGKPSPYALFSNFSDEMHVKI